jgi:hypothetical protein
MLRELPGFENRGDAPRIAREYSRQDVAVLAVCCELEARHGLRRDAIASLVSQLRQVLAVPRSVATDARLVIRLIPPDAKYFDGIVPVPDGTVVPLQTIFGRIDSHLGADSSSHAGAQRSLDLGPVEVPSARGARVGARKSKSGVSTRGKPRSSGVVR